MTTSVLDVTPTGHRAPLTGAATPLSVALRDVILDRLAEQQMTTYRLAKRSGILMQRMYRWTRGDYPVPLDQLYAIAQALGTTATSLVAQAEDRLQ